MRHGLRRRFRVRDFVRFFFADVTRVPRELTADAVPLLEAFRRALAVESAAPRRSQPNNHKAATARMAIFRRKRM
jgi:hypothetical protein